MLLPNEWGVAHTWLLRTGRQAMTPEELARAVERLRVHSHSATIGFRPLAKPLAAFNKIERGD